MTHIVTDLCIKCKYTDCVEVCPVDCFQEGINMLVINPEECIDCGVCIPLCPANAIVHDIDIDFQNDPKQANRLTKWLTFNMEKSLKDKWPKIIKRKDPMKGADQLKDMQDKDQYLIDKPF